MTAEFCLVDRVQKITGWSDNDIAVIVGLGRSTIQAYRSGRLPEYLDGQQIHNLMQALALFRDKLIQDVAELELMT